MRTAMPGFGMSISTFPDDPKRSGYVEGAMLPMLDEGCARTNGAMSGRKVFRMKIRRSSEASEVLVQHLISRSHIKLIKC